MVAILSPNGSAVKVVSGPPKRLLVATISGVAVLERSENGQWTKGGQRLEGFHPSSLLATPDGTVFAGIHKGKVFRSLDNGDTWSLSAEGITPNHVFSLAYRDDGTIFAGTEPVGIFQSKDNGDSWQELPGIKSVPGQEKWTFPPPPHIAHTKSFTFDRRNSNTFYVMVEQGALLKTTDGGASWRNLDGFSSETDKYYRDCHRLVQHPDNPDHMILLTGVGVYDTFDSGETFSRLTDPSFRIGYPDQIIPLPGDSNTWFMCGAAGAPPTWIKPHRAEGWVMKTTDNGKTWEDFGNGLPPDARINIEAFSCAVWPTGFELYAGDTDGNVYCSQNGVNDWTLIASDLLPISKVEHYRLVAPKKDKQLVDHE